MTESSSLMTDVERISEAVYAAIAGMVLRGHDINPQDVLASLERVQESLGCVRAYWLERARDHWIETNLKSLRTEPVQVALTDLDREGVGGLCAFKVHKDTTAAKVFERNGWREVRRRYSVRYFVMPDGSEPPAHLTPVIELAVPTREEVVRLANLLHGAKASAVMEVGGLFVSYSPSSAYRMTNRLGKEYTRHKPARFTLIKDTWLVAAIWSKGDDRPRNGPALKVEKKVPRFPRPLYDWYWKASAPVGDGKASSASFDVRIPSAAIAEKPLFPGDFCG